MYSSTTQGTSGVRSRVRRISCSRALVSLGLSLGVLLGSVPSASADLPRTTAAGDGVLGGGFQQALAATTPGRTPGRAPANPATADAGTRPSTSAVGSFVSNPATGRREVVVPDVRRTAVLIGDSQSGGPETWPRIALRNLGYSVSFAGAGGIGFVAANDVGDGNYYDSLIHGDWVLPHGEPALVVIEGGGNDAGRGASDGDILANANALVLALERTYPSSRMVMIGTLSRSAEDGGARRTEVDALLGYLAEQRDIPFVSAGDWLTTHDLDAFLADEVHLNAAGHQKAARVLERDLAALKLGAAHTAVDPLAQWPREQRPLE